MTPPELRLRSFAASFAMLLALLGTKAGAADPGTFEAGYFSGSSGFGQMGGGFGATPSGAGGLGGTGGFGAGGGGELGVGQFGRFPFRFTVSLQAGYDDNVYTNSAVQQGSAFTNLALGASYQFGSPRTEILVNVGGGITYYYNRPQQSAPDYNAFLSAILRHRFTARLTLDITSYTAYQVEPDFSLNIGINRRAGNYFYTSDKATLTYLFSPRFSTATSYTFGALLFDNSSAGDSQNRVENTLGNEFRFLIQPTTTLVGEYRIQLISYTGGNADSFTHFFLVGADETFNPRLTATVRGGIELREYEGTMTNNASSSETSPYAEATVIYVPAVNSTIDWTTRYGIQEPDIPSSPRRTTFRTGLNVNYHFTPRISARFAGYYQLDNYDAQGNVPGFTENSFDLALSVRYALTRYLGAEVGYNRTDVLSGQTARDYSRDRIYAGVDFVF
ncbi:MAG: outer membrane beta-barrel protein [Verrucomicrobia bacterium]|nr:outer membrane beta-barrel protein [Verrucomicrobiota bacterium]